MTFAMLMKVIAFFLGVGIGGFLLIIVVSLLINAIENRGRPKWKHANRKVRLAAIAETFDQKILAEIAQTDFDEDVRKNAANKVLDPEMLIQMAHSAEDEKIRLVAAKALQNWKPRTLPRRPSGEYTRYQGFADVAQRIFADLAAKATDEIVRTHALKELKDQKSLASLVKTASQIETRCKAIEKLTDQPMLEEIARSGGDSSLCLTAAKKLINTAVAQDTFARIAKTFDDSPSVLLAAADLLADRKIAELTYTRVAKGENRASVEMSKVALIHVTAQDLLAAIARESEHQEVAQAALDRITEQEQIAEVAKGWARFRSVRVAAVNRLAPGAVDALVKALGGEDGSLREAAALRALQEAADPRLIAALKNSYAKEDVEKIAKIMADGMKKLGGTEILEDLRKLDEERRARKARREQIHSSASQRDGLKEMRQRDEQQRRCHHVWVDVKTTFCSVCQSNDTSSACRICGRTRYHICT
jgi:hypothetical protein